MDAVLNDLQPAIDAGYADPIYGQHNTLCCLTKGRIKMILCFRKNQTLCRLKYRQGLITLNTDSFAWPCADFERLFEQPFMDAVYVLEANAKSR